MEEVVVEQGDAGRVEGEHLLVLFGVRRKIADGGHRAGKLDAHPGGLGSFGLPFVAARGEVGPEQEPACLADLLPFDFQVHLAVRLNLGGGAGDLVALAADELAVRQDAQLPLSGLGRGGPAERGGQNQGGS